MSRNPVDILGLPPKRDIVPKPQLPTKRKRDTICGLGNSTQSFEVKPSVYSPYDKSVTFKPVRIIGRSQLPFSFLDASVDTNLPVDRRFYANIDVLEQGYEAQEQERKAPMVLIARHETKRALYAIERIKEGVYSLCKLINWVKEKDVAEMWDPSSLSLFPISRGTLVLDNGQESWWKEAIVTAEPREKLAKLPRLSMLRPQTKPQSVQPGSITHEAKESQKVDVSTTEKPCEMALEIPSPQEQLESLVRQYLDAIYMSKTSLAYLAKGPITRIRNAFTSIEEGAPPTHELVTFLKSMLLSHKAGDKKYREKLPEMIKSIPPGYFSDEEAAEGMAKPRKKKKVKLSREGLYPQEEELVKKWWTAELPTETYGGQTIDQRIKRRIDELRVRETLAQMILMLEIVALEALSTQKGPQTEEHVPAGDTKLQEESQSNTKKRKKKLEDIHVQLDLLLDKLCIWQSIDQDGILDFDSKPARQGHGPDGLSKSNDRLQSFCVEVIVPFYMNRLPEQARMINKKLGGPVQSSPPKRKAMKPPMTSRKTGELKESESKRPRRSFGRVATDSAAQTSQRQTTPSLSRSATDTALLNGVKREASEKPLSAIPFQRSPSNASRHSMSQFKHMKGRQVDLDTPSAAAAAKLKQKKRVEEELNEAIVALKKPNRGLAAGGYVDDIERRGLGPSNKSRKPAVTVRKVTKDIQVSATPATRRTKDIIEQTPIRNPFVRNNKADVSPPSSSFCIPSSAVRPTCTVVPDTEGHSAATVRNLAGAGVAETPSKAPNHKSTSFSSGAARRTIFATPLKARASSPSSRKSNAVDPNLFATPTKRTASTRPSKINDTGSAIPATPTAASPVGDSPGQAQNEEPDIYAAMGWNDDDDLF